jgi:hypothetical protein
LRAEGFSCSIEVLYEGLRISNFPFLIKKSKKRNKVISCNSFQFLVIKTLDPHPEPDSLAKLDPYP